MSNPYRAFILFILLPVAVVLLSGRGVSGQGLKKYEERLRDIAERGRSATVKIIRTISVRDQEDQENEPDRRRTVSMTFSGVLIRPDGHIVTVSRPVQHSKRLTVSLGDKRVKAKVVGTDRVSNLAVLKVEGDSHSYLSPAKNPDLRPGSLVIAVGNAYGLDRSISTGVVSGSNRTVRLKGNLETGLLQMTAPVNPGDQGGPVISSDGRLIGVVMGTFRRNPRQMKSKMKALKKLWKERVKRRDREAHEENETVRGLKGALGARIRRKLLSPEGIHFAVPSGTVRWVTDQLIQQGTVQRGWIGVYIRSETVSERDLDKTESARGFRVVGLDADGPAQESGIRKGDIILGINGERIQEINRLRQTVFRSAPGTSMSFRLLRAGKKITRKVTIASYDEKKEDETE